MVSTAEIEFFCARGHVTRVPFSAEALFEVPSEWECEVCHQTATRIPPDVRSVDEEGPPAPKEEADEPSRHLLEAQSRRSEAEQEEILRDALRRLLQEGSD